MPLHPAPGGEAPLRVPKSGFFSVNLPCLLGNWQCSPAPGSSWKCNTPKVVPVLGLPGLARAGLGAGVLWLLGSTGEGGLVLVGSGKEPWARCRQMERESDKEAEQEQEGLSRGQPGSRQGAGRGAGTGIPGSSVMVAIKIPLLFFCFSSFRDFFFFPPLVGNVTLQSM